MAQLSETWQQKQLLQSFCSQAASATVLRLSRACAVAGTANALEYLDVLLSLYGDSLCCTLLPDSASAAAAAHERSVGTPREDARTTSNLSGGSATGFALPSYLERSFWGPLKLTDESVDEGVAAFAACTLQYATYEERDTEERTESEACTDKDTRVEGAASRRTQGDQGLILTYGASGLVRLMLLTLQETQKQTEQEHLKDSALRTGAHRLGGGNIRRSDVSNQPWAKMQLLQKWKGTSSVARVASISEPLTVFTSATAAAAVAPPGLAASASETVATVRLAAVGCVGGEVEVVLLQQTVATPCCSLKHPAGVTVLKFHPSRALLAAGTADGLVRVYDLSFAAAATIAAGTPAAAEHVPFVTLKDHVNSISALTFLPAVAAAALQQPKQLRKYALSSATTRFLDVLVSAGTDALINAWCLKILPHTAGLLLMPQQFDRQHTLQQLRKSAVRLQKGLQQKKQQKGSEQEQHEYLLLMQLPTVEVVTAMTVDFAAEEPLLLSGGSEGLVKLWDLKQKKVLKVLKTVAALSGGATGRPERDDDLGAFIRTLLLLPTSSSYSDRLKRFFTLLVAQDSGLISVVSPLPKLANLCHVKTLCAAESGVPRATTTVKKSRGSQVHMGLPNTFEDLPEMICLLGRLDGLFACRWVPQPPEECRCSYCCCSLRRNERYASGYYPSTLLALTGDPCGWLIDLGSGSLGSKPLGFPASGFTKQGQTEAFGHQGAVSCCDISKRGCWVLTGSRDGALCLWQTASGHLVAKLEGAHEGCITAVAFQRKNWAKASQLLQRPPQNQAQEDNRVLECMCDCRGISPSEPHALLFVSCCEKNSLKLWRVRIPQGIFAIPHLQNQTDAEAEDGVEAAAGRGRANGARDDSRGPTGGLPLTEMECLATVVAHSREINDIKFAPNDSVNPSHLPNSSNPSSDCWEALFRIVPSTRPGVVYAVVFSAYLPGVYAQLVATASTDKTCRLLSVPSLAPAGELRGHRRAVQEFQFAERERVAATASLDGTIRLWNLSSFTCIKTLQGDVAFLCVRFLSLDTQVLAFAADGSARLFNCRTADCVAALPPVHTDKVWALDLWGAAAVSGGADGRLCVWRDVTAETKAAQKVLVELERITQGDTDWALLVGALGHEEARTLLGFVAEWTAEPAMAAAAHGLLNLLLRRRRTEYLFGGSTSYGKQEDAGADASWIRDRHSTVGNKPAGQVLRALELCSQRQERRVAALLQKSFLLDLLLPGAAAVQEELHQLLFPLQQHEPVGKRKVPFSIKMAGKKRQKVLQDQQLQHLQEQPFVLSAEALQPHFGTEFTERCLYGET
ncbi:WD-40 repeat-containing protein [Cyclospora cayetanensis]|uniref:WD-40 repeat-containing protein n=1 Tax=Cyclospora cayetanensis TaxID=88456 RepID=A0A1D3D9F5_9EIME|nr:WD-40 repeat-containing protein [Cyclospora cayetanensis]